MSNNSNRPAPGNQGGAASEVDSLRKQVDSLLSLVHQQAEQLSRIQTQIAFSPESSPQATAEQIRKRAAEIVDEQASPASQGQFAYRVQIKGFKREITFRCDHDRVDEAVSAFERRFGTRWTPKHQILPIGRTREPQKV